MTASNELTFLTSKWTIIYTKCHRKCRFTNLVYFHSYRIVNNCDCITNVNIRHTTYSNDCTNSSFLNFNSFKTFIFIELSYSNLSELVWVMVVYNSNFVINMNCTIFNLTNTNLTNVFVVINSSNEHTKVCIRVTSRCRNMFDNCIKKWLHIRCIKGFLWSKSSLTHLSRCKYEWRIKLFISCIKFHEKFKNFINNFFSSLILLIYFVYEYNNRKTKA